MTSMNTRLPISLYPTAAQDRLTEGQVADLFAIDIREVRAMNSWSKDLLISRAIEANYIPRDWKPRSHNLGFALDELSHATCGHWSRLLSPTEREERRHVQFVLRVLRRQFNTERNSHVL